MQTATLRTVFFSVLASASLLLASCNKASDATPEDTISAEDSGAADDENATTGDLMRAASPADVTQSGSPAAEPADLARILSPCAIRTYDAATRTLTIDFGPTNCVGPNGRARRGKLVFVFSGPYRQVGAVVTITPVNYYVNDNLHTGTRIITDMGDGSYSLNVQNASVTTPNGVHSWSAQRTFTRLSGGATRTILDDEFNITGSATGTNRRGVSYTATIQQPLHKVFTPGCSRHFVSGTISFVNARQQSLLLNYDPSGTAACDNIATVTINGRTRTITLR
ncbi:hypothetical protein LJY25_05580 [Hymenobacter sp. BT175]|uniref:hypothetical protein n=1 Tax=Hymenobacter translucens TaxID=2886507 RepID=UPI001D0E654E|nr:hypothetical protein [Hymenobacter translucens]MCC2545907.1 hypothetical protein [Hymenobacter translucens]